MIWLMLLSFLSAPVYPDVKYEAGLLKKIKNNINEPEKALKIIYNSNDWKKFLYEVESGNNDFLEIWPIFRKNSDAGATEELDISLGKLVDKNPKLFLITIRKISSEEKSQLKLASEVCSTFGLEVHDLSFSNKQKEQEAVISILKNRKSELSKTKIERLELLKKVCLDEVNKRIIKLGQK